MNRSKNIAQKYKYLG